MTEFREVFLKIKEEINCPRCLKFLHAPVAVCINGHGTCPDCRAKTTRCSICDESFQSLRVRPLDDILSIIFPRCKFEGCREVVRAADDHKKVCIYRPTACMTCKWKGCVKDIIEHIRDGFEHSEVLCERNIGKLLFLDINDQYDKKTEQCIPMIAYEEFFWLSFRTYHDEKEVRLKITHVPRIKLQCWFKIKLTIPPQVYEVSSIMSFNDLPGNRDNFLSLPYSTVKRVLDRGNGLTYNLSIDIMSAPDSW